MSEKISVEFLEQFGFRQKQFPDGSFWIRHYTSAYYIQVNEDRDQFNVSENDWVDDLSIGEFVHLVEGHQKAIAA